MPTPHSTGKPVTAKRQRIPVFKIELSGIAVDRQKAKYFLHLQDMGDHYREITDVQYILFRT